MSFAVAAVGALLCLAALAGCGFCVHAGLVLARYAEPAEPPGEEPDVTMLKPLHGEEPGLLDALRAAARQDYGGAVELRLGVQNPQDPALGAARRLAEEDARFVVVLDETAHGTNRKVSNLINLERAGPLAAIVVQTDSDIEVVPDHLRRLAQALAPEGIGVASCLYHGVPARPELASRLAAMMTSYQGLPLFAVGVSLGATPCMGSTIALRRETLEAIGGWAAVKDVLADDYELGARVRALGLQSVVPPFLVGHRHAEASFAELWRHEVRWSRTTAGIDPAGHAGSVVTHPLPLALLGAALLGFAWPGLLCIGAALAARLWLKRRVDGVARANGWTEPTGPWRLLPIRDMLSFAVFVGAYLARGVDWRGARFHVGRGGELLPAKGFPES